MSKRAMTARIGALLAAVALPAASLAGPVTKNLGGGWQVTIFDPINVDVVTDFVNVQGNLLVIEKFANFVGLDPITGLPKPAQLLFEQIEPDVTTVSRIVLTDEIIVNNSGLDWNLFREELIPTKTGEQVFNQALSATFSIDPFTTRTYNDVGSVVDFSGGIVPAGSTWAPGVENGGLYIDIDLDSSNEAFTFVLKEIPIPEPASALGALLAAALGVSARRR